MRIRADLAAQFVILVVIFPVLDVISSHHFYLTQVVVLLPLSKRYSREPWLDWSFRAKRVAYIVKVNLFEELLLMILEFSHLCE